MEGYGEHTSETRYRVLTKARMFAEVNGLYITPGWVQFTTITPPLTGRVLIIPAHKVELIERINEGGDGGS